MTALWGGTFFVRYVKRLVLWLQSNERTLVKLENISVLVFCCHLGNSTALFSWYYDLIQYPTIDVLSLLRIYLTLVISLPDELSCLFLNQRRCVNCQIARDIIISYLKILYIFTCWFHPVKFAYLHLQGLRSNIIEIYSSL